MKLTHKPKWILFDVGGVLLDWRSSLNEVARTLGITRNGLFDVLFNQTTSKSIGARMLLGDMTAEAGWAMVLQSLGNAECTPIYVLALTTAKEFWLEDTLKLITELHNSGYKLAIMSNSWLGLTDPKKKAVFPKEIQLFDEVFDSSVERMKKPDVKFYELVERRTGSKATDLLLVDDDEKNLVIAKQQCWQTYRYNMGSSSDGTAANSELRKLLLSPVVA